MNMTEQILTKNDYVKTADLCLAGFLSLHFPLEAIEKTQGDRKVFFLFKRDDHIDELMAAFWRGQTSVEPQTFFGALRVIKGRIYGETC